MKLHVAIDVRVKFQLPLKLRVKLDVPIAARGKLSGALYTGELFFLKLMKTVRDAVFLFRAHLIYFVHTQKCTKENCQTFHSRPLLLASDGA